MERHLRTGHGENLGNAGGADQQVSTLKPFLNASWENVPMKTENLEVRMDRLNDLATADCYGQKYEIERDVFHLPDVRFHCDLCDYSAERRETIKHHLRSTHGTEIEKLTAKKQKQIPSGQSESPTTRDDAFIEDSIPPAAASTEPSNTVVANNSSAQSPTTKNVSFEKEANSEVNDTSVQQPLPESSSVQGGRPLKKGHNSAFSCDMCPYQTRWKYSLIVHSRLAHGQSTVVADVSPSKICPSFQRFKRIKTDDDDNGKKWKRGRYLYKCPRCDYVSNDTGNAMKHFNGKHVYDELNVVLDGDDKKTLSGHSERPSYSCKKCPYKTRWRCSLIVHSRIAHGESSVVEDASPVKNADGCPSFQRFKLIKMEDDDDGQMKNAGKYLHICPRCDYVSNHLGNARLHFKRMHVNVKIKDEDKKAFGGQSESQLASEHNYAYAIKNLRSSPAAATKTGPSNTMISNDQIAREHDYAFTIKDLQSPPDAAAAKTGSSNTLVSNDPPQSQRTKANRSRKEADAVVDQRVFTCKECPYQTRWKYSLIVHSKCAHGESMKLANVSPSKACPSFQRFKRIKTDDDDNGKNWKRGRYLHKCPRCDYVSNDTGNVMKHFNGKHVNDELNVLLDCFDKMTLCEQSESQTVREVDPITSSCTRLNSSSQLRQRHGRLTENRECRVKLERLPFASIKDLLPSGPAAASPSSTMAANYSFPKTKKDRRSSNSAIDPTNLAVYLPSNADGTFANDQVRKRHSHYVCQDCDFKTVGRYSFMVHQRVAHCGSEKGLEEMTPLMYKNKLFPRFKINGKLVLTKCPKCEHVAKYPSDIYLHLARRHSGQRKKANACND